MAIDAVRGAGDSDGHAVARAVAAARHRLRTVAMLQHAAIAGPGGVTAGAALAIAGWAPVWAPAALGLLAAAGAATWSAAHTPSPAAVARILDTRLGLRDRVAAALQLQPAGGPIASLVARDAAARLGRLDTAALFPLGFDRAAAASLTVAAAMVAWLAAAGGPRPDARVVSGGDSAASDSGGAAGRAAGGSRAATAQGEQAGGQRFGAPAQEPRRGSTPGETAAREASAAPAVAQSVAAPAAGASQQTSSSAAGGQSAPSPGADGAGRAGRGGSAAGRAATGALAAGAGGAAPGNALATTSIDGAAAAPLQKSYSAARAGAEAALARDVIPPDYRDHVRAYFRALPATGTGTGGSR
jgi:hypothetical protein